MPVSSSASSSLRPLPRLRAWFGLSQLALGHCLGLSKTMISQVERGLRPLPMRAALPQAALALAQHRTAATPETAEAPDTAALRQQARASRHRADQLAHALSLLPEQATWARRRLAALPTLHEALAPAGTPPPPWLAAFEAEARTALARAGSTAQALLQARIAGLRAEAAALEAEAGS